jgi:hypothetical protein
MVVLWLLVPFTALAVQQTTPLTLAGVLHLVLGNLVIGALEGLFIAAVFRVRNRARAVLVMIGANYVSSWIGGVALASVLPLFSPGLLRVRVYLGFGIVLAFLATTLLEWPFIVPLLRHGRDRVRQAFRVSLVTQFLSFLILVPFYNATSSWSLFREADIQDSVTEWAHPDAVLYYLSNEDNRVYARVLCEGSERPVGEEVFADPEDRLFVHQSPDTETWNLYVLRHVPGAAPEAVLVLEDVAPVASSSWQDRWKARRLGTAVGLEEVVRIERGNRANYGSAVDLRAADDRAWRAFCGLWPHEGMWLEDTQTKNRVRLALATPFVRWSARNGTILPGDQVVFQWGDQICLFERDTARLGLVTNGRGPVVVLRQEPL